MAILDKIRGILLEGVDWVNVMLNPFDKFKREAEVVDDSSLSAKADAAWGDIQGRWLHGPRREFYWHMRGNDLGDMAIWHGFYVAACAFRQDLPALSLAVDGLERLQYLGGNSRLCRGAGEVGGPQTTDPSRKYYTEGKYVFTDDCSESSLIGYLFGAWAVWRASGDKAIKSRVAHMVNDLAEQIWQDGEVMLNQDGTKAKFGHLKPGLFTAPIRISALACLYLIADVMGRSLPEGLRCQVAGERYSDIVKNHSGALTHPETHFLWIHPWYQDLLAYVVLTIQATMAPEENRAMFRSSMRMQCRKNLREGNPFFAYMMVLSNGIGHCDMLDGASVTMREFNIKNADAPSCKRPGSVVNSGDARTPTFMWGLGKRRRAYARQPVPSYRRPPQDIAWQRCPYALDGSDGYEYNNLDFVLAYHMGRYIHVLS